MNFTPVTGYSQNASDQYQQNYLQEVLAILGVFTDDALRLSGLYCLHSGRHSVTKKDTILALKTRAYHGDSFWNRSDIQQRITEMKQILAEHEHEVEEQHSEESESDYDENVDEEEMSEEDVDSFIKSECTCEICTTLNEIQEKWETWYPTDHLNISIKNSINSINGHLDPL